MAKCTSPKISYLSSTQEILQESKDDLFDLAAFYDLEQLHIKQDLSTGLKAIIAIHNTVRGPALGGTRCLPYPSAKHAIHDAMQLARSMSYKSAFAGLNYGGGKGVLIRPKNLKDRKAYFEAYGEFIENLGGQFITAIDVGTQVTDMNIIASKTKCALSTSKNHGDPSLFTAKGVFESIRAVMDIQGWQDFEKLHIGIQGVGKVGYHLARILHQQGAKLTICDIDSSAARRCAQEFNSSTINSDQIYQLDCDIFCPCALGNIVNDTTLSQFKTRVICGAANNQLASENHGDMLYQKNVFYVPDYVANAGGLIHVVLGENEESKNRLSNIYHAVVNIYQQSKTNEEPSHRVANRIAEKILLESKQQEKALQ